MNPCRRALAAALLLCTFSAHAGNGLNDIGYGAESAGMTGADAALARDTAALTNNPAGLTQIERRRTDLLLEPFTSAGFKHRDELGNDARPDNLFGGGLGAAYAQRFGQGKVVGGLGFFIQGGAGWVFRDFVTPISTRDELSSQFGTVKLAQGLGWQINERWSLGVSGNLLYSTARQKFFPDTAEVQGFRADGLYGFSFNGKAGLQYRPAPDWVLALVYTSEAPIKLENGELTQNLEGQGLGNVRYRDAQLKGLAFGQEVSAGLRVDATSRWTLVGELTWTDWSSAMREAKLRARDPDKEGAPATFEAISPLDWRDQYLVALGALYRLSPTTELRGGVSHARNPIPDRNLTPTLALITQTSLGAGFTRRLSSEWDLNFSAVWQPPVKAKYDGVLTQESEARLQVGVLYISFSRHW